METIIEQFRLSSLVIELGKAEAIILNIYFMILLRTLNNITQRVSQRVQNETEGETEAVS